MPRMSAVTAGLTRRDLATRLDLGPYINRTPLTVTTHYAADVVYKLFMSMKLRHLPVVDARGALAGIITRLELLKPVVQHRYAAMVLREKRDVRQGRPTLLQRYCEGNTAYGIRKGFYEDEDVDGAEQAAARWRRQVTLQHSAPAPASAITTMSRYSAGPAVGLGGVGLPLAPLPPLQLPQSHSRVHAPCECRRCRRRDAGQGHGHGHGHGQTSRSVRECTNNNNNVNGSGSSSSGGSGSSSRAGSPDNAGHGHGNTSAGAGAVSYMNMFERGSLIKNNNHAHSHALNSSNNNAVDGLANAHVPVVNGHSAVVVNIGPAEHGEHERGRSRSPSRSRTHLGGVGGSESEAESEAEADAISLALARPPVPSAVAIPNTVVDDGEKEDEDGSDATEDEDKDGDSDSDDDDDNDDDEDENGTVRERNITSSSSIGVDPGASHGHGQQQHRRRRRRGSVSVSVSRVRVSVSRGGFGGDDRGVIAAYGDDDEDAVHGHERTVVHEHDRAGPPNADVDLTVSGGRKKDKGKSKNGKAGKRNSNKMVAAQQQPAGQDGEDDEDGAKRV